MSGGGHQQEGDREAIAPKEDQIPG